MMGYFDKDYLPDVQDDTIANATHNVLAELADMIPEFDSAYTFDDFVEEAVIDAAGEHGDAYYEAMMNYKSDLVDEVKKDVLSITKFGIKKTGYV